MVKEIKWKSVRWIFSEKPDAEEVARLAKNYNIHPVVADELTHATLRPKVDRFQNFLYVILHFPIYNEAAKTSSGAEIDFIIGKDFLITVCYEKIEPLDKFFKELEENKDDLERFFALGIEMVFYQLLSKMYDFALRQLDHIKLKIDMVDGVLSGNDEEGAIKEIFLLRRDVLNFRRAIKPHETIVNSLALHGINFFGKEMEPYFKDIIGEYYKVWNMLENHKETTEAFYDTHISFQSMHSNEVMKKLTLMAFITFPLSLIAAIFSMTITPQEFFGMPHDFLIVLSIIVSAVLFMLFFFKRRRWF